LSLTGGQRVIATHARGLQARGHEVEIVAPRHRPVAPRQYLKAVLRKRAWPKGIRAEESHVGKADVAWRVLDRPRAIEASDVNDADVIVATWWETAEWAARMPAGKGAPVHFIQGHEVFAHLGDLRRTSAADRVRAAYRLPMQKIVVSRWLGDLARDLYGDSTALVVPNAVDHELFRAEPREKATIPTVGVVYSTSSMKNTSLALDAFTRAKARIPALRLIAFGRVDPIPELPLPSATEFTFRPAQQRIRNLYAACDAWLFSSTAEGFGLPILEAMACRTPVIATRAGAAPEILEHGGGVLLDTFDPDEMARAIVEVVTLPGARWSQLSDEAAKRASQFTWEESTSLFEAGLQRAIERRARGEIGAATRIVGD
jgi:glycosyltransferase involved in cell wall biosynthesis